MNIISLDKVPVRYKDYYNNLSNDNEMANAFKMAKDVLLKGGSLYIYGRVGTGKTALAVNLLPFARPKVLYQHQEHRLLYNFIVADELWSQLSSNPESKLEQIKGLNSDLLILDDLSLYNFTPAKQENLFLLINRVYMLKNQVIITSNFNPKGLEELDPRIYSRLNEISKFIELKTIRRKNYEQF